jgi:hypothetical protein
VVDVAVVGDDQPVALVDRPEFAALSTGPRAHRAAAAAALNTAINSRTTQLLRTLREAAAAEPDLAARLVELREAQRQTAHVAGARIAGRELTVAEGDGLWVLITQEVYELLTGSAGWSPAEYEAWLTEAVIRLLCLDD